MSASTEKKLRQAARQAGLDKKTQAAREEAEKKARSKRRWTIGTVCIVLLVVLVLLLNSSLPYTVTTAMTVGGESYSPAQLSYYYAGQYYNFVNQYGSYASIFGLDTSTGITGLDAQSCPMLESGSWRDYFLQAATGELTQTKALLDYAAENGIELNEEEIAQVDAGFEGLEESVKAQGYSSVNNFFSINYGRGVTESLMRQSELDAALASKVLSQISEGFEYTGAELEDYYQSLNGESDVFDFAYYYVAAETVSAEGEAEDAESAAAPTEETLAEAKATAEAILAAYDSSGDVPETETAADADADETETETGTETDTETETETETETAAEPELDESDAAVERFDAAIASQVTDAASTRQSNSTGSSLGVYKEWLMDSRSAGEAAVVEDEGSGYYVVLYLGREDNHYNMAQVRHILVMAEADADGNYTDEAKAAALERAEELYAQWQDGEASEESFAAMANEYSEDPGSNTNGGLYDNVTKGQMVEEFDRFCFEGHKSGDTAIVYGQSSGYAGYHIMYYVGEGELYSDYIAESALRNADLEQWMSDLSVGYEGLVGFGYRFVG